MHPKPPRSTVGWGSAANVSRTSRIVLAALTVVLVAVVPAGGVLVGPVLTSPDSGTTVDALPPFKWEPVEGAASYSFEFSGDPAFNSTHATATTKNTRATRSRRPASPP
jgi:hypothetical protein